MKNYIFLPYYDVINSLGKNSIQYLTTITNKQLFQESDLYGIYILLVYRLEVIINSNKLEI